LENLLEDRLKAVVLMKIDDTDGIESVISRLGYSPGKVFVFNTDESGFIQGDNFSFIHVNSPLIDKEEFLVIVSENFSATIYWSKMTQEIYGLSQGTWSFNPGDARYLADYLVFISDNKELKDGIESIKADRRYDEKYTNIMTKLVTSLENRQRDLICANKELKELHQKALQNERLAAIGQVSSVIAHELRNPLGLIDLYAKILLSNVNNLEITDQEQKEILGTVTNAAETIRNATGSLEKILSELLDYSRPLELDREFNNLQDLIEELQHLMQPKFNECNVGLKVKYNVAHDIEVKFDKVRLNQALLNLVKNALEVSKPGDTVSVNVDCRSTDGTVYVKVADQGPGIPDDNMEKLFTPYFSTKTNGTGLGLAQSKKIMKAHNGDIEILSTGKDGTTFALILPGQYSPLQSIETF
jgi:signal transduction histidine kinase